MIKRIINNKEDNISIVKYFLTILITLYPLTVLTSLPYVDLGVWRQTELSNAFYYFITAFLSLGLLFVPLFGSKDEALKLKDSLKHPFVLISFTIGLLGIFLSFFHDEQFVSILGTIKHGIGALWFLTLGVIIASIIYLKNDTFFFTKLFWGQIFIAIFIAILQLTPFSPYDFSDYLGWIGLFIFVSLLINKGQTKLTWVVAPCLFIVFSLISENKIAIILSMTLLPISIIWGYYFKDKKQTKAKRSYDAILASVILILSMIFSFYAGTFIEKYLSSKISDPKNYQTSVVDVIKMNNHWYGTIWARSKMLEIAKKDIENDENSSTRILIGNGWGTFPEAIIRSSKNIGDRTFEQYTETASPNYLDFRNGQSDFHSHNMLAESLYSNGILSELLTIFLLISPLIWRKPGYKIQGYFLTFGLIALSTYWFPMIIVTSFMALAYASLANKSNLENIKLVKENDLLKRLSTQIPFLIFTGLISLATFVGIVLSVSIITNERYMSSYKDEKDVNIVYNITPRSYEYKSWLAKIYDESIVNATLKKDKEKVLLLAQNADYYLKEDSHLLDKSLEFEYNSLITLGHLLKINSLYPETTPLFLPLFNKWEDRLNKFLIYAPERTDLAAPYIEYLLKSNKRQEAYDFMKPYYDKNPEDPVALWVTAINLAYSDNTKDKKEGFIRYLKAINRGVVNYLPFIDKNTISQVYIGSIFQGIGDKDVQ